MIHPELSRRSFVARVCVAGAATIISSTLPLSAATSDPRFKIIAFTKPFRTLNAPQTAELVANIEAVLDGREPPNLVPGSATVSSAAP